MVIRAMQTIGKVSKWGNSLGLRINQKMADELQLAIGSEVSLTVDETEQVLVVSPIQKRKRGHLRSLSY